MKNNFLTFMFWTILILCLTGCNLNKEIESNDNIEDNKNYALEEINLDCNLQNVLYIDQKYIMTKEKIYEYSDKKFTDTDTNCRVIVDDATNYKHIGIDYGEPIFKTNENKIIKIEQGNISLPRRSIDTNINASYFYQGDNFYIIDNNFYCINDAVCSDIQIPNSEKILYTIDSPESPIFIITEKNQYILDINQDDKCYNYVDSKCTYELIKTNIFDDLLNYYKDNISYFDGLYLTKNNKIYKVIF